MPITDAFGNSWETRLSKRGLDAIRDWDVEYETYATPPVEGQPLPPLVKKTRKLGIDVTNVVDLISLQLNIDDTFELLAAWLFPQWQSLKVQTIVGYEPVILTGREAFEEVCDPDFVDAAMTALVENAKRFFRGRVGQAQNDEYDRLESEIAANLRPAMRQTMLNALKSAGLSMPESSGSGPLPVTSPGGNSNSSTSVSVDSSTPSTASSV